MAAAGCKARATRSNIGGLISPRAAIAVFSISYRLAGKAKTFPEAVQDVLAGVQFLRGKAGAFGIDPARIGLIGASAGAHLAALAALGGKKFAGGYPQDAFASADAGVKALVGVYGIYDAVAMWTNYQVQGGRDNNFQKFMGASPMENRQLYFDASPISYATFANNAIGVLLVTGTEDALVDRKTADRSVRACAQAGRLLRAALHRARRAALLDERSDRRARQLFRLSGAAAVAFPRREALRPRPAAEYPRRIYPLTFTVNLNCDPRFLYHDASDTCLLLRQTFGKRHQMLKQMQRFLKDESGAAAIDTGSSPPAFQWPSFQPSKTSASS